MGAVRLRDASALGQIVADDSSSSAAAAAGKRQAVAHVHHVFQPYPVGREFAAQTADTDAKTDAVIRFTITPHVPPDRLGLDETSGVSDEARDDEELGPHQRDLPAVIGDVIVIVLDAQAAVVIDARVALGPAARRLARRHLFCNVRSCRHRITRRAPAPGR